MSAPRATEIDTSDRDVLTGILREHQAVANGLGEWACKCSPMEWRPSAYRCSHMAEALILSGRVQVIPPVQRCVGDRERQHRCQFTAAAECACRPPASTGGDA